MSFYLYKEWIDIEDDICSVFIHYTVSSLGEKPDWQNRTEIREMIPVSGNNRKYREKVIKLPRQLYSDENYLFYYFFRVKKRFQEFTSKVYIEEIIADNTFQFIDYSGYYTNICLYWSINNWNAPNYSTMFEEGISLEHPLNSLHFYGRSHDGVYIFERYNMLQQLPLPHVYHGKVHGPKGSLVNFCFHIMRRGSPYGDDYDFWNNNETLDYHKRLE